jgi:tetratricopeptide (TPR) repeat protein
LEKSLAILDGIPRSAISRLLEGMAYFQLGEPATALGPFDEAIRLDPNLADAYTNRGASYNALGQYQRAIQDLDEAIKLNPRMALAYNNRGNSFGNLDQLQRSIEDYDEAIRLNPQFALAYSNRALAYTYLGRDDDARSDIERGTELGLDPGPILAKMEEVKANR